MTDCGNRKKAGILEKWKCDVCGDSFVWPHVMGGHRKNTHLVQISLASGINELNLEPYLKEIILKMVNVDAERRDERESKLASRLFDAEIKIDKLKEKK